MEYTMTDRIYDLTLGKIENYIAKKRTPKYIEMVREEIKKIDPNNLEETEKLKEFIENKVPYLIKKNENFMLTLLKENEELPNIRKAIANANSAIDSKDVMNEIFKHSEIDEFYVVGNKLRNDKDFVLSVLKNNYKGFNTNHNISDNLKNDREVMLEACRYCNEKPQLIYYDDNDKITYILQSNNITDKLGDKLKNDKDFILEVVNQNFNKSLDLEKLIESFTDDKEVMSAYLEKYPRSFHLASERLKNDKDIALIVAEKEPYFAGEYIPRELYKDKEILKKLGPEIDYYKLSEEQLKDKEIALLLVKETEIMLDKLPIETRYDREVVLEAVKTHGNNLQYAPQFVSDREVVLAAVKNNGMAIEFASKRFADDKEIMLEAVKENGNSLKYASPALQNDKELVLEAVKQNGNSLKYVSETLKNDREVVLVAVKNDEMALRLTPNNMRSDKEVVMTALKNNGDNIKYVSDELRKDKEVIMEAVKTYGLAIAYASEQLRSNKEIALEAIKNDVSVISYLPEKLRDDKEIALEVVKNNAKALEYISDRLREDKEIAITAIKTHSAALNDLPEKLKNDKDIVLTALKQHCWAIHYASPAMNNNEEIVLEAYRNAQKDSYYSKPRYEELGDEIKAKYTEDDLFKMAYEKNEKDKENIDIKENISETKKEVETSKSIEPEKVKESETNETKTPEKVTIVEKKVENSKPKETSKEKPTRSRIRSTGNER